METTRRTFIRQAACAALTTTGILNTIFDLRRLSAAPLDASGYKALVCLFLYGGNDANNLIVPHDTNGYASYAAARGALAIPQNSLLPLTMLNGDGRDFAFHPNLLELQSLFNQGKLGLVSNVGTLVAPVTRAQYLAGGAAVPPQLFSHADQSVQWQTSVPDQISKTGWGGRMADMLQSLNAGSKISLNISIAGTNTFEVGNTVLPYILSSNGSVGLAGFDNSANANVRLQAFKDLLALPHNNLFEQAYSDTVSRSIAANDLLTAALAGVPAFQTVFPATNLGQQLKMIAKLIAARTNLSMNRQIFFCSVGGYDTHGDQLTGQANLFTEPGPECVLFRHGRAWNRSAGDNVHRFGFRTHFSDEWHRLRSRMGKPPVRPWRCCPGREIVRHLSDSRGQRPRRYRSGPLDPDDVSG
jgi:uncharacterized protein (DUF1501 family)